MTYTKTILRKKYKKYKYTTVALNENQHLVIIYNSSIVETYCNGYTDNKRHKDLDGHYFTSELNLKE